MDEKDTKLEVKELTEITDGSGPTAIIDDKNLIETIEVINEIPETSALLTPDTGARKRKSISYAEIDSGEDDTEDDFSTPVLPPTIDFPKFPKFPKLGPKKNKFKYTQQDADGLFPCPEEGCKHRSKNKGDLSKHMRCHSLVKPYACPVEGCDFKTAHPNNIRHHMVSHQTERPFSCDICSSAFKKLDALRNHVLVHSDEKPLKCDKCDYRCKRNWEMTSHKLKHSDVRKFTCEVCGYSSKTKSDLTKHIKGKHGAANMACPMCDKTFTLARSLNKHMERIHSTGDRQKYPCVKCGKILLSHNSLRNHDKIVHQRILKHTCEVCKKCFGNRSNLLSHMVVHDESRPFVCDKCPFRANTEDHLRTHIGAEHPGEKTQFNYCETCDCRFRHKNQFRQHLKTEKHVANEKLKADGKEHLIKKGSHVRKWKKKYAVKLSKSQHIKRKYAKQELHKHKKKSKGAPTGISRPKRKIPKKRASNHLKVKLQPKKTPKKQDNKKKSPAQKSAKNKTPRRRSCKQKGPLPLIEVVRDEAFLLNAVESGGSLSQIAGVRVKEEPVDYTQKRSFFNLRDIVTFYGNNER